MKQKTYTLDSLLKEIKKRMIATGKTQYEIMSEIANEEYKKKDYKYEENDLDYGLDLMDDDVEDNNTESIKYDSIKDLDKELSLMGKMF